MIHSLPLPLAAMLAWVAGRTRGSPRRARWHSWQPQFHCGNPPPAAAPRTSVVKTASSGSGMEIGDFPRLQLAGEVAVDFQADADFAKFRAGPGHWRLP